MNACSPQKHAPLRHACVLERKQIKFLTSLNGNVANSSILYFVQIKQECVSLVFVFGSCSCSLQNGICDWREVIGITRWLQMKPKLITSQQDSWETE